ncbi:putative carboxylesterase 12-like [Dorcoceras hygrometricum]|uniref:Putative carboxylesterase 12-like n=1 Tax=Dorcoceras hygrometricum TaxID=472368 RepID=A0A2Z7D0Z6_9LAMI|nr:putative carboxylesterase 12-like [Dorcoceras hygrometricum]
MPPRRTTTRQTGNIPQTEQGSTSTNTMNAAATPMETLLKRFQSFKPPTLTGTENAIDLLACFSRCFWLNVNRDLIVVRKLFEFEKLDRERFGGRVELVSEKSNAIVGVVTTGFECLPPSCDGLTGPDDHGPMISTG